MHFAIRLMAYAIIGYCLAQVGVVAFDNLYFWVIMTSVGVIQISTTLED